MLQYGKAVVLQHSPWGGYNCRQTAWNSGAQAVEMSAEGTVDPARAFVSLCAQVLVSVGAKRRKIHCDHCAAAGGRKPVGSSPSLLDLHPLFPAVPACCLCIIWQGICDSGKSSDGGAASPW